MPEYPIVDPGSGRRYLVSGPKPPSPGEKQMILRQLGAQGQSPEPAPQAPGAPPGDIDLPPSRQIGPFSVTEAPPLLRGPQIGAGAPPSPGPMDPHVQPTYSGSPGQQGAAWNKVPRDPQLEKIVLAIGGPSAYDQQLPDRNSGVAAPLQGAPMNVGILIEHMLKQGMRPAEIRARIFGSIGHDIELPAGAR